MRIGASLAAAVAVALIVAAAPAGAVQFQLSPKAPFVPPGEFSPAEIEPSWSISPSDLGGRLTFFYYLHSDFGTWAAEAGRGSHPTGPGFPSGGSWSQGIPLRGDASGGFLTVPPYPPGTNLVEQLYSERAGKANITGFLVPSPGNTAIASATTSLIFRYIRVRFGFSLSGGAMGAPLGPTYIRSIARGAGAAAIKWNGKSYDVLISHGTVSLKNVYLHGSDRIKLRVGQRRGGRLVAQRGPVYTLALPATVIASDDPDCPRGKSAKIVVHDDPAPNDVVTITACGRQLLFKGDAKPGTSVAVVMTVKN